MAQKFVVLDTGVLYAVAAPYEIEEISALAPVGLVVPFSVLAELDMLMQRTRERDRARAAINVLKILVDRGAAQNAVSCGKDMTIRLGTALEEIAPEHIAAIDVDLADDRVLACAVNLAASGLEVVVATTEFALHAKALTCGVGGLYLDKYADTNVIATHRERSGLDSAWNRLLSSNDSWAVCRRAINLLRAPLVARLMQSIREEKAPANLYDILSRFEKLMAKWDEQTPLASIISDTLLLAPAVAMDDSVKQLKEPTGIFVNPLPPWRSETPEERVIRMKSEEAAFRSREDYIIDVVLTWMGLVREYVLDHIGESE